MLFPVLVEWVSPMGVWGVSFSGVSGVLFSVAQTSFVSCYMRVHPVWVVREA